MHRHLVFSLFVIIPPLSLGFRVKVFREFLGAVFAGIIRIAVCVVCLFVRVKAIMRSLIHRLFIVFVHRLLTSYTYYARLRKKYTLLSAMKRRNWKWMRNEL